MVEWMVGGRLLVDRRQLDHSKHCHTGVHGILAGVCRVMCVQWCVSGCFLMSRYFQLAISKALYGEVFLKVWYGLTEPHRTIQFCL